MGTEYAGLTVVFGAEASKYNRVMKDMRSAASKVQRQLNEVQSALDLDPTDAEKLETVFDKMREKAATLSAQLKLVNDRIEEIGSASTKNDLEEYLTIDGTVYKTVEQLAESTDNAALAAATAKERYNNLNAELEKTYKEAASTITKLTGIEVSLEDIKTKSSSFDAAIKILESGDDKAQALASSLTTLRSKWQSAFDENQAYKAVLKLEDLTSQAARLESQIDATASEMSALSVVKMDSGLERAQEAAASLDAAMDGVRSDFELSEEGTKEFNDELTEAKKQVKNLKKALDNLSESDFAKMASEATDLTGEIEKLRKEFESTRSKIIQTRAAIDQLESEQRALSDASKETTEEYKTLTSKIEAATQELDQLVAQSKSVKSSLDVASQAQTFKDLQGKIKSVNIELEDMSDYADSNIHKMGEGIKDVGQAFEEISQVAQNVLGEIVDATYDVTDAYADMRKTVDGTEQDFEDLYTAAMEYSTTSVTSASEILSIEAVGGQLGLAVDELEEFATVVSNLSIATDLDADTAATDIGQLANILDDLTTDTMSAFGDALVRLGNNTATTESTILDIATRIGSEGSVIGFTSSELLALSATVAEAGVNAESGGTAIVNTMSDIETAVSAGGDDLKAFADVAGVSSEEFAETWETKPIEAIQLFVQGLADIDENGGSVDSTLESLGITGVRQKTTIEALVQTIDNLDDNLSMSEDAWAGLSDEWGSAGDAANEAEKKSEGFAGQLTILQNSASNLAAELGDTLTPYISTAADVVGDFTVAVGGMTDSSKTATLGLIGMVAAIGPVLTNVGSLVSGYGNMIVASKKSQKNLAKAAKSVKSSNTAFAKLATTLNLSNSKTVALSGALSVLKKGLVVAGAAAAAYIAVKIVDNLEKQQEYANECATAWQSFDEVLDDAYESSYDLKGALDDTNRTAEEAAEDISDVTETLADFHDEVSETYSQLYADESTLDAAWEVIDKYGGSTELSATNTAKLSAALDTVNGYLGTSYSLHEDTAGAIYDENDERVKNLDLIKDEIEAYKDEAEAAALSSLLEEASETLYAAESKFLRAQEDYDNGLISATDLANARSNLNAAKSDYADIASDIAAISAGLSDETRQAIKGVSTYYQEAFANIEAAFSNTMGDDFTAEFEESLTSSIETAIETGDWSEVMALAEDKGVEIESYLLDAYADGAAVDEATAEMYAALIVANEEGADDVIDAMGEDFEVLSDIIMQAYEDGALTVDEATEILAGAMSDSSDSVLGRLILTEEDEDVRNALASYTGIGTDVVDSLCGAIDDGLIDVDDASYDLLAAIQLGDYNDLIQAYGALGIEIPDSILQGISDGEVELDNESVALLASLMLDPSSEEYASAIASATGLSEDYIESTLSAFRGADSEGEATAAIAEFLETLTGNVELQSDAATSEFYSVFADKLGENYSNPFDLASTDELLSSDWNSSIAAASILTDSSISAINSNVEAGFWSSGLQSDMTTWAEDLAGTYGDTLANYDLLGSLDLYDLGGSAASEWNDGWDVNDPADRTELTTTAIADLFNGLAENASDWGTDFGTNYGEGVTGSGAIAEAVTTVVGNIKDYLGLSIANKGALGSESKGGKIWGRHLTENWAEGMVTSTALRKVSSNAEKILDAAAKVLEFSVPEEGPFSGAEKGGERSGRHLAENFAAGIASGKDAAVEAAEELAYAVQDAMEDATFELAYSVEAASVEAVESAVADAGWNVASFSASSAFDDVIAALGRIDGSVSDAVGTTINQTFETKVVRSDADLYTAAPIIYRNAMREASLIS